MPIFEKWKEESATAVATLSTTLASATATGLPDLAKASSGVTFIIVNNFYFAESPEAVSDRDFEELQAKIRNLEAQIELISGQKTQAQKCKEEFERNWQEAATKPQMYHCLMTYCICLVQGFNVSFPIG